MNSNNTILCFIVFVLSACGDRKTSLFEQLPSSATGIHFNNLITENDSINPLKEINIYNGGGVGIGDFNNDSLQDIYFTGNMVSNKLYLNKGDLEFDDVTQTANVDGEGKWCRGVSVVDINNDGRADLYVSVSIVKNPRERQNLLYVNQGNDNKGIPVFKEMAAEYGLNDTTHTTMAHFFDYDNDGDLDVYLVVNQHIPAQNQSKFTPILADGSHPSTGRLYRNDWNEKFGHPVFTNVSLQAHITTEGYGHAAIITDINRDGWKDIYVTNDFISNNILYINNQDGTFTDRTKEYFKQTSTFSMGVDFQDLNNDGLLDAVELDMNPQDNYRKKMMLGANSYQTYQNFEKYKYQYQYSRNTIQLNQGRSLKENDTIGSPVFSQIGYLTGMAETDWSWTPLVTDFDDDGFRDIIITNGYPKDVTDHDFMIFRSKAALIATPADILRQVPEVKIRNYAFKNNGNLGFLSTGLDWGLTVESFSNGASYADLDNDGDMDIVINNINDEALVYRNNSSGEKGNGFLNVQFEGDEKNRSGFGAWLDIYYDGKHQVYEHSPYRGYISSIQDMAHFGVGSTTNIDSVVVIWPDRRKQVLKNVQAKQVIRLNIADASLQYTYSEEMLASNAVFRDVTHSLGVNFIHKDNDFADFNIQKLLPHKLSEYSPALAAGDVNGDGLDDFICGGTSHKSTALFLQQSNGTFIQKKLFTEAVSTSSKDEDEAYFDYIGSDYKDSGILLFDADGDGDLDIYISGGGYAHKPNTAAYRDRLYVNDGKGNFKLDQAAVPENFTSKFCVRASDYDKDGDLDLFVAGRVDPWNYPRPVSSFILRNDSEKGKPRFTDVTKTVAKDLVNIGMVCDAVFTDFDNDGWQDLMLAGEWMPLTFLKNKNGVFTNVSGSSAINDSIGWWNSIAPGDFDNDGDIDYIVGNLGKNSFFKADDQYPIYITAKDFDNNGSYDAFPSIFLPTSHNNPEKKEYPVPLRDDAIKQVIGLRAKFQNYKLYASATMQDLFAPDKMEGALRLKSNMLLSAFVRNDGNGKFAIAHLPVQAQVSVLGGMVVGDFDGDNNLDVVINGNDYGTDVSVGRYDALNGLLLKGDGKGNFSAQSILQSGIYIPGNGKALVALQHKGGKQLLAASQNNGPLKIFELKKNVQTVPLLPAERVAVIKYKNGTSRREELYYGYSFLSQSGRFLTIDEQVSSVEITDSKGKTRNMSFN